MTLPEYLIVIPSLHVTLEDLDTVSPKTEDAILHFIDITIRVSKNEYKVRFNQEAALRR